MPDELINVRYMVDDVESAVAFYTTHFGFTLGSSAAPAFADVDAREPATAAQRPAELGRAADAGRPDARAGRLEPHPLRRR